MIIDNAIFNDFDRQKWKDFYHDAREEVPIRMPEPLGNPVQVLAFVDANHAGNMKTRRSHTGILIYILIKLQSFDDEYYMFRSYNNCCYSSSEPVTDEEDEL